MRQAKKILIVEDNEINMKLLRALLKIDNYKVIEKQDAIDIVDVAIKHKPDLIIMDLGLPEIDGITATKMLKSHPQTCNIPVIAITAHVLDTYKEQCHKAGFDGFICKPIDTKAVLETIRNCLSQK